MPALSEASFTTRSAHIYAAWFWVSFLAFFFLPVLTVPLNEGRMDNLLWNRMVYLIWAILFVLLLVLAYGASLSLRDGRIRLRRAFLPFATVELRHVASFAEEGPRLVLEGPGVSRPTFRLLRLTGFSAKQRLAFTGALTQVGIQRQAPVEFRPFAAYVGLQRVLMVSCVPFFVVALVTSVIAPEDVIDGESVWGRMFWAVAILFIVASWAHAEVSHRNRSLRLSDKEILRTDWRGRTDSISLLTLRHATLVIPLRGTNHIWLEHSDGQKSFLDIGAYPEEPILALLEQRLGRPVEVAGGLAFVRRKRRPA